MNNTFVKTALTVPLTFFREKNWEVEFVKVGPNTCLLGNFVQDNGIICRFRVFFGRLSTVRTIQQTHTEKLEFGILQ